MAHLPSQSSVIAPSQLGRACSLPSKLRSRGRAISTLPPWKPILPFVLPQRCAVRSLPRPWRGPHAVCASASIISPSASSPAARQSLSKLAEMLASASIFNSLAGIAVDVISLFMALLSSREISTPSLQAQGEQRRFFYFNNDRDIPSVRAAGRSFASNKFGCAIVKNKHQNPSLIIDTVTSGWEEQTR